MRRIRFLATVGGLLASWALLSGAHAQQAAPSPAGPQGNDKPVLVTADELQYDQDLGLVVAKGHVELSQQDEILLADTVTYNQRTDTVTASGNVSLTQPAGDVAFADYMELRNNFRDGFIKDVRMLLFDGSRLAGNTARRAAGTRTEVKRAVYSPCELCAADPTHPPVWQIKAEDVVDDKELKIVEYHDAIMEIDGFPVFYAPYFSHPDPSVKRASGLLPIVIGNDPSNGFRIGLPYYLVIGPDKDATFRPIFTTQGGTVLDGQYRQRFGNGALTTDTSLTFGSEAIGPIGDVNAVSNSVRGHMAAHGIWDLTPGWRTGFDGTATTDQTYLQRYHFPYTTNFLTDHVYAEHFGAASYGDISSYAYQNLNPLYSIASEPFVLPVATYTFTTPTDALGGRWQTTGNMIDLAKRGSLEERRLSLGTNWRLPFNGPLGDRYQVSATLRGDGYNSTFGSEYGLAFNPNAAPTPRDTKVGGRVFPQAAVNWHYPWVNTDSAVVALIEPIAAAYVAPPGGNSSGIPNEDAQSFEFDDTDLFVPDRFPGYDRVDGGQRVDYGLHAGVFNPTAGSTQLLVGESYRFQRDSQFPVGTGLDHRRSDVVGRVTVAPDPHFNLFYRARVDSQDFAMRRQEVGTTGGDVNLNGSLSYIATSTIPGLPSVLPASQVSVGINFALTDTWSGQVTKTQNLNGGLTSVNSALRITYRDDCLAVTGTLQRSGITFGDIRPGTSFVLTFIFRNLGDVSISPFGG